MDMVRHNTLGIGEVVSKEVINGFTYLKVCFEDGRKMKLGIPVSFEHGAVEALGALKDEVDQAIAAKKLATSVVGKSTRATKSVTPQRSRAKRSVKVHSSHPTAIDFESYLAQAGYRVHNWRGGPSTVHYYVRAVESVLDEEGMSWAMMRTNISSIVPRYDVGGAKELFGAKGNGTVINALRRFEEFVNIP